MLFRCPVCKNKTIRDYQNGQYVEHLCTTCSYSWRTYSKAYIGDVLSRDQEIIDLRLEGETLQEIGEKYGITRERVRQILYREGFKERPMSRKTRAVLCAYQAGMTVRRISQESDVSYNAAHSILKRFGLDHRHDHQGPPPYENERLLDYLRQLADRLGHTPSATDIIKADGLSHTLYYRAFGSLRKAQALAGLVPNKRGGKSKTQPYACAQPDSVLS